MIFTSTALRGAFIIDLDPRSDHRGFFARTFCVEEFRQHGLKTDVVQCNLSFNFKKGVFRGMHYQAVPATETKLVRCTRGAIYDVIIDLRSDSPTYKQHIGLVLSAENRRALYVPEMFAHGYQTLAEDTEVVYQVSEYYNPAAERGVLYNDPAFAIQWPEPVTEISDKDSRWPLLGAMGAEA